MRGVRCEGFVAAHGGVPPSGPLLLGLLVEVVLGYLLSVGRRLEYRSRFVKQIYKFIKNLSKIFKFKQSM
jgi:hypothetical protein